MAAAAVQSTPAPQGLRWIRAMVLLAAFVSEGEGEGEPTTKTFLAGKPQGPVTCYFTADDDWDSVWYVPPKHNPDLVSRTYGGNTRHTDLMY